MAKDTVYDALQGLGFGRSGMALYGTWGGYAVAVVNLNGNFQANVAVRVDRGDKQLAKSITEALRANGMPKTRCNNFGDHLQIFLRFDGKSPKADQFRTQINTIVNQLGSMGITPAETCAVCGASNPESLCMVGNSYQPVHRSCVEGSAREAAQKAQDNKENGSYILGIIGAVIGALIGIIPSVITILTMEYIYAVLFALVPLCAAFGYKKLGGKKNVGMIVIIIILSLLSVFILQFLVAAYYVADGRIGSIGTAFAYVVSYYMNPEGIGYVISNSLQEFLFMAIGILIAWRYVGTTNKTEMKKVSAVMDTVRANPAFTQTVRQPDTSSWQQPAGTEEWQPEAVPTWQQPVDASQQVQVDAGASAQTSEPAWQSGASFEAGGPGKKKSGFDV